MFSSFLGVVPSEAMESLSKSPCASESMKLCWCVSKMHSYEGDEGKWAHFSHLKTRWSGGKKDFFSLFFVVGVVVSVLNKKEEKQH